MPLKNKLALPGEPVYLVDGTAYIFRAFYAYQDMTRSDGFATNAIFNIMRMLLKLIREEDPKYLLFFMDGKGPNFRHELYEPYKAQRTATPEPLIAQLEPIEKGVSLMGFPVQVSKGCEADDLICSAAARLKKEMPVVIIGADKDLRQCLDDNVYMWDPVGRQEKITTLDTFQRESNLRPDQWPDFQAVIGDSSDNIPGIRGVGPKTAAKIFERFPTLEDIKANVEELTPAERKKVEPALEDIFLFRELTRLRTDSWDTDNIQSLQRGPMDFEKLAEFLAEYEFRGLSREFQAYAASVVPAKTGDSGQEQFTLFTPPSRPDTIKAEPFTQGAAQNLAKATAALVPSGPGFRLASDDSEWTMADAAQALPVFIGALSQVETLYVPSFKDLLSSDSRWNEFPLEKIFDLGLAAYLINPEDRAYTWERLSTRWSQELDVSPENPALLALAMGKELGSKIRSAHLADLMRDLEIPLIPVLAAMEQRGIGIDSKAFAAFLAEVEQDIEKLSKSINEHAGVPFNHRSSQQLADVLFNRLGLKPGGKTPGGAASTSQAVLEKLAGQHPIVDDILAFRKLEKLRSTYLAPLPKLVDEHGRIHTTFNQLATATGRLSSSNPNLQNIPIRGEMGLRMRSCFVAQDHGNIPHSLVAADYSQIELRVLAHMSQDPTLLDAFRNNQDIHSRTAGLLFDKDAESVTTEERRDAKTINFGLIYGMGPQKLAQELQISLKEAKEFIARYFERLSTLKQFYESVEAGAKEVGYVTTLAGRRRLLPDIHSKNQQLYSLARRQAVNTLIQGSAADIIKMAMLQAHADKELKELKAALLLQVHDELLFEAPSTNSQAVAARVEHIMANTITLDVPLSVDFGTGRTWADAH